VAQQALVVTEVPSLSPVVHASSEKPGWIIKCGKTVGCGAASSGLTRVPAAPGLPRKEQHRIGRMDLLNTSFETFEEKIRDQLGRVLGGGFDPARDIVAIIVNRWPHGYAYSYNSLYDPMEWVLRSVGCIRRDALRGPSAVPRIGEQ
jgi:hypothetical protein